MRLVQLDMFRPAIRRGVFPPPDFYSVAHKTLDNGVMMLYTIRARAISTYVRVEVKPSSWRFYGVGCEDV